MKKLTGLQILGILISAVLTIASWYYVTPIIWLWFVVPLGLPTITGAYALGLSQLVGLFNYIAPNEDRLKNGVLQACVDSILRPWFIFLFAWIYYQMTLSGM